jgi:hypothetical protein
MGGRKFRGEQVTKIIFFILTCATCNLTEITMPKKENVDCFEYGNAILKKLEYREETDDMRAGHYTKLGYLVLGYRCE